MLKKLFNKKNMNEFSLKRSFCPRISLITQILSINNQRVIFIYFHELTFLNYTHEYQKIQAAGFELLVKTFGSFIGKDNETIYIRQKGKVVYQKPVRLLRNITVIAGGVSLSSNVIWFCAKNNISIDFLGKDGKPYSMLVSPNFAAGHTMQQQLAALQNGKAAEFVVKIIVAKITNQINVLKYFSKSRAEKDADFKNKVSHETAKMQQIAEKIELLETKNINNLQQDIFLLEAQAAGAYWAAVANLLEDYHKFDARKKQGATDLVNSMLNYGYGILYARVWEALMRAKLNPYIGYLHSDKRNDPALVFDFIEQFRQQIVDRTVFSLITKRENMEVKDGWLTEDTKIRLSEKIFDRLNTVIKFRGSEIHISEIIFKLANQLASFIEGKTKNYKPFVGKW